MANVLTAPCIFISVKILIFPVARSIIWKLKAVSTGRKTSARLSGVNRYAPGTARISGNDTGVPSPATAFRSERPWLTSVE